jgi:hypothetical protein
LIIIIIIDIILICCNFNLLMALHRRAAETNKNKNGSSEDQEGYRIMDYGTTAPNVGINLLNNIGCQ